MSYKKAMAAGAKQKARTAAAAAKPVKSHKHPCQNDGCGGFGYLKHFGKWYCKACLSELFGI